MEVDKEIEKVQNEIQKVKNIMDIKKQILKLRKIKPNSINAYLIILKKLNDNRPIEDLEFLKNTDNIMGQIQKKALTTRRNYIGALLVAVPLMKDHEKLLEFYQDELKIVNAEYQVEVASHKKSVTQEKNWMTQSGIRGIYNKYKVLMKREKYNLKESLTISEFNILTNFVVVSLYVLLKPVRLDFAPMKVIKSDNNDDDKSNFLVIKSRNIKYFIINEYKSSKSYGKIKIEVPSELNTILNLYLKFHLNVSIKDEEQLRKERRSQNLCYIQRRHRLVIIRFDIFNYFFFFLSNICASVFFLGFLSVLNFSIILDLIFEYEDNFVVYGIIYNFIIYIKLMEKRQLLESYTCKELKLLINQFNGKLDEFAKKNKIVLSNKENKEMLINMLMVKDDLIKL